MNNKNLNIMKRDIRCLLAPRLPLLLEDDPFQLNQKELYSQEREGKYVSRISSKRD